MLAEALRARGLAVTLTREPGGSPGAEEIRRLVLTGDPARWSPETEILLFTAARRDHLERTIRPALARGEVVITDRFADSTRMYQGIARGAGGPLRGLVDALHAQVIGVEPDLTFLIDIDPALGLARAERRPGDEMRFEAMGQALQARMRAGFLDLARADAARFRVIDGDGPPEAVAARVLAALAAQG
jgi:dTMP kinase